MEFLKNFLRILLDLKFENYITLQLAGIALIIAYIFDTIFIFSICFSLADNILLSLSLFILFYPLSLIFIRVNFETLISIIKIAQSTSNIEKYLKEIKNKI